MVSDMADDTRQLKAGDAFLCMPRVKDKDALIAQAISQGAATVIVIGEQQGKCLPVACACLPDMVAAGAMLRRWFETEAAQVPCIGITGTDGKTSTAWMLREALALHLGSAWSCGTLGWIKALDDRIDLGNTTPSLMTLHTIYALACQANIGALVLEVSSHGIAQERIAGLPFTAAVWTTIGQDHLEYHGGFDAYSACKASFIKGVVAQHGVVVCNADYPLIQQAMDKNQGAIYWYGKHDADVNWTHEHAATCFSTSQEKVCLSHAPAADFHAENLAAVVLLMHRVFDVALASFTTWDSQITTPIGRLEPANDESQVFIDYAHTAEGLKRCLQSARELSQAKLLLVFGCGGDRDKSKRAPMGKVAATYADTCWLTSDNPRSEQQEDIAKDVLKGMKDTQAQVHIVDDRAAAITQAVSSLASGDVLVIAGKGHESYMEVQGKKLPWSDKAQALAAMQKNGVKACV
ncbi:MAG: UDP-N-acetylmuramoyl-L-alanyl-D-glutamate--2,6-diaminopimelate ligase, partial [Ghiorsea sp.]|nr:UDP-N-acetylmuramoyl-L-alanyl-D-glutamate--2,6-diaminopimelate ligase [Ghiorsea sp.]